mmetsp:Transcript_24652/g.63169  ORF Transcript_24652/g.63169 Transcript_24652/m.63169 type:complete len:361 (-) Transcript_24652:779-1861(-)
MEVGAVVSREATPALLAPRASLSALRLHRRPASTHSRPPPPRARAHAPRPPPRAISPSKRSLRQGRCFGWRSAASGRSAASTAALLDDIQGDWEDDVGNAIRVTGDQARFSGGSGSWAIQSREEDGVLQLRGAELVGSDLGSEPRWRFPNGVERTWARPRPVFSAADGSAWSASFHAYKATRLQLRRRLWSSVASEDFGAAAELQQSWQSGAPFPEGCAAEEAARLAAGRWLVPGVPCLHRRYGYRCVVIGCEPWCRAPTSWRQMMGVATLPRGETQPFYHCIVDERDRPGSQVTFVGEENLDPNGAAFPLESRLVGPLLVQCDELRGYLPSPRLEAVLRDQTAETTLDFSIMSDISDTP